MKRFLKNFYFQLLFISLIVYFIFHQLPISKQDPQTIYIGKNVLESIEFKNGYEESISKKELEKTIEQYIKNEIDYRNAVEMGLEKNDEIIKKILIGKYNFILEEFSNKDSIDEKVLKEFYQKNKVLYMLEPNLSFYHILKRYDLHENAKREADKILPTLLSNQNPSKYIPISDPFILPNHFVDAKMDEIKRDFGRDFYAKIITLQKNKWVGPIKSGIGYHLVFLNEINTNELKKFEDVKNQVKRDYIFEKNMIIKDSISNRERKNYNIIYSKEVKKILNK